MHNPREEAFQKLIGKRRALVVEDERSVAESIKLLLDRFGVESVHVFKAEDGIKRMAHEQFDLILVNLNLPTMSGDDLLRWCQKHRRDMPAVIVSGLDMAAILNRCEGIPFVQAWQKPFTLEDCEAMLLKLHLIWTDPRYEEHPPVP